MVQAIRRLPNELFPANRIIDRNTGGTGNSKTKLVTFKDAIQLVMVLPGLVAKETRAQFAAIIERYLAGDQSLHAEIEGNARSSTPIAQLARESVFALGGGTGDNDNESALKRRRLQDAETMKLELENHKTAYELYAMACPDGKPDERMRLLFKDNIYNLMTLSAPPVPSLCLSQQGLLTNEDEQQKNKPITISTVASELKMRFTGEDLKKIGMEVSKRYMARYAMAPTKHEQLVLGGVRQVNSYTMRDKDLVESVLREWNDQRHSGW